jgi:hypothetical protein
VGPYIIPSLFYLPTSISTKKCVSRRIWSALKIRVRIVPKLVIFFLNKNAPQRRALGESQTRHFARPNIAVHMIDLRFALRQLLKSRGFSFVALIV